MKTKINMFVLSSGILMGSLYAGGDDSNQSGKNPRLDLASVALSNHFQMYCASFAYAYPLFFLAGLSRMGSFLASRGGYTKIGRYSRAAARGLFGSAYYSLACAFIHHREFVPSAHETEILHAKLVASDSAFEEFKHDYIGDFKHVFTPAKTDQEFEDVLKNKNANNFLNIFLVVPAWISRFLRNSFRS